MIYNTSTFTLQDVYDFLYQASADAEETGWHNYAQDIAETREKLNDFMARYPYHFIVFDWKRVFDKYEECVKKEVWKWLRSEKVRSEYFDPGEYNDFNCPIFAFSGEAAATKFRIFWE